MVIGDFVPSAFDPLIKQATAAGIPVVLMNTGTTSWQPDGAIGFVGEDGLVSGQAGGTGAVDAGIHHLLCVNEEPLNPVLHQRCQGTGQKLAAAGGTMAELDIPTVDATNGPATTQDIEGYLRSHRQIDGVETLGPLTAVYALAALKALGETGKIKVGTFDVSSAVLQDIKQGKLSWAVDQQPYLQGFDSLQIAAQYARYKIRPLSPILTSGVVVNSGNVDQVMAVQQQYPGLRGLE
jgi:simple sugar transport system substrate-binding protein